MTIRSFRFGTPIAMALLLVLAAGNALAAAGGSTISSTDVTARHRIHLDAEAQSRAGLAVETIRFEAFGNPLPVIGQIVRAPGATIEIRSILDGRVETIHVAPGARVKKGERLVTLHSHALHQLQGELLAAHEALRMAENQVAAGHELLLLEGISRLEAERRQQEALRAEITFDSLVAELEDLGYQEAEIDSLITGSLPHPILTIRAPEGGVVLDLAVQQHSWVQRYEDLLTIGDPARLELELQIPPAEAPSVARGDRVTFAPVGQPARNSSAEVITPVPTIDPMTRTVTIRARVIDGLEHLLAGLYIEGTLERGRAGKAAAAPESSVIRIDGSDHVFVQLDAFTFEARPVVLGRYTASRFEVVQGLEVGEKVAVAGVFLLKSALLRGVEE